MKKEIILAIISSIITVFITIIFQYIGILIWGEHAKIELISSEFNNSEYVNVLAIKNIKDEEYLKNVSIEIDNNIKINSVKTNNINHIDNKFVVNSLSPNKVSMIVFTSSEKITNKNVSIIKNKQKISMEYFNDATNYRPMYLILIIFFFVVDFIVNLIINNMNRKEQKNIMNMYNEAKNKTEKIEKHIEKFEKKDISRNKLFLKEISDKEKEIKFYQQLLLKNTGNNMSKEELEEFIIKNLKSFNKRKIKYIDYNDILQIISDISYEN